MQLVIPRGDKGYTKDITVMASATEVEILDDYTVKLKAWSPGSPGSPVINATCTNDPATDGLCHYTITGSEPLGRYIGEIELINGAGTVVRSTKPFEVIIIES